MDTVTGSVRRRRTKNELLSHLIFTTTLNEYKTGRIYFDQFKMILLDVLSNKISKSGTFFSSAFLKSLFTYC